ncbi:MAG: GNAT family N-acetyltransferase [Turicibacter sp.]
MNLEVRHMNENDYEAISAIYYQGIESKKCTFETSVPYWKQFNENHLQVGRLVALNENNQIIGWVALSAMSSRPCFKGVAEVSIYVDELAIGKGVGSRLMEAVIQESEKNDIWSLYSGIFFENTESIKLHKKFGFRTIGYRERVGKTEDGLFKDVLYLERRSQIVGS